MVKSGNLISEDAKHGLAGDARRLGLLQIQLKSPDVSKFGFLKDSVFALPANDPSNLCHASADQRPESRLAEQGDWL